MQTAQKLGKNEIVKLFQDGCKTSFKIGMEYERLPIFSNNFNAVDYGSEFGICNFLRNFARCENWDYITDDYNIIGLKQEHDTITLEPGCQLELSIKPENTIFQLKNKIENLDKQMSPILDKFGIKLLKYGVSPLSTNKNINLIPKKRYNLMAKYLWGILSDVMMRETAGIQCCIDFESEEDAVKKFMIANKLSPFMTAMFANSPIRGGVETGYKSFRALSWLNTDNDRCGFVGNINEEFSFEKYVDYVLKTPMIFINRNDCVVPISGKLTFDEFMENGYEGYEADITDFELHANLYFPEVRMRNFLEIRNHDCVGNDLQYSIMAIYKGILYNKIAINDIEELFAQFSSENFSELRYNVPKNAMNTKIGKYFVKDFAKEILYIAEKALIEANTGEEKFLEPIKEYTLSGICPADIILRNWNGVWNKNIQKLVEFVS
jgi:glutamate--cysteine ligase